MSEDIAAGVLCRLSDIPDGQAIEISRDMAGEPVSLIVWRNAQTVAVYRNVCPHTGRRLDWAPGKFLLKDGVLVCAAHGASFAVNSGVCIGGPCRGDQLAEVPVMVQSNTVYLAVQTPDSDCA